jgi:ribose-phosphate pyrophosphokinase
MKTLNLLDPGHSDLKYQAMIFPDGQPHLKLDMSSVLDVDKSQPIRILARMASATDFLTILFAKNILDYLEYERIELHLSYLLAARMDRVMNDGEPFSLKVIATMLNAASFDKVRIFDPHSEVSTALIDRAYTVTNHSFVKDAIDDYFSKHAVGSYCLVSPDAGALKKIHKLAISLGIDDVVECLKERDLKTGALSGFQTTAHDLSGKTCFIVDDICDGGGTFAGTAKMLKEKGAATAVLIVSHGIFSKGVAIPAIDAIYTTDSYKSIEAVSCFAVEKYLEG